MEQPKMQYPAPVLGQAVRTETIRPLASFHPSLWGDYFLHHTLPNEVLESTPNIFVQMPLKTVSSALVGAAYFTYLFILKFINPCISSAGKHAKDSELVASPPPLYVFIEFVLGETLRLSPKNITRRKENELGHIRGREGSGCMQILHQIASFKFFLTTHILKEQEAKKMKEEVRKNLLGVVEDSKERLIIIDVIQRLGVAYHFEEEIEIKLQDIHKECLDDHHRYKDDLHYVSLRFRLLRQHGFDASCEVFEKFKHANGSFKDSLASDAQGMLNLYEASYIRVHGENILEEAQAFATTHLEYLAMQLSSPLVGQINHALKHPLHRRTTRLQSRYFISFYENDPSHDERLLGFAKLDFDLLQSLHRKELRDIIRWSKDLKFTSKLPFIRDREEEAYFWTLGVFYEPKYSFARIILNKFFKLISIVDDIYDAYGIFDELELFTEAIQRWDESCMRELPDYMKFIYKTILDTFQELEQDLASRRRSYAVYYLKQEMKASCQAYFQEAKWSHESYVPTYDEYMKNGIVSGGYFYMIAASYQGMGEIATTEAFEWIHQDHKAPTASCILARICNDMGSHKFEQSRGHVASAVECYVAKGALTEEEALDKLWQQEEEAWMNINKGIIGPTDVPMPLIMRVLNLTRALYDVYKIDEDGYTLSQYMQEKVAAALINPALP